MRCTILPVQASANSKLSPISAASVPPSLGFRLGFACETIRSALPLHLPSSDKGHFTSLQSLQCTRNSIPSGHADNRWADSATTKQVPYTIRAGHQLQISRTIFNRRTPVDYPYRSLSSSSISSSISPSIVSSIIPPPSHLPSPPPSTPHHLPLHPPKAPAAQTAHPDCSL